jgi:ABC-type amino acid transport substrate-binding protein
VGYEYSLLKSYEAFLNKPLGSRRLNIVFEFIPVTRDELIPRLVNGFGDIAAAGLTITKKRQEKVAFSQPYLSGIDEVVVTGKDGFQPENIKDLSGRKEKGSPGLSLT